jgi:hypothetical protein
MEKINKNRFVVNPRKINVIVFYSWASTKTSIVVNLGYNPLLAESMAKDDLDKFLVEFDFSKKMDIFNEKKTDRLVFCKAAPFMDCRECTLRCPVKKKLKKEEQPSWDDPVIGHFRD